MICPGLNTCFGAHQCSLDAFVHAIPNDPQLQLTEIVRGLPWGFHERRTRRVFTAEDALVNASTVFSLPRTTRKHVVLMHILVGEGVARPRLQKLVELAADANVDEVWTMEHNRNGRSWSNPSQWPRGRLVKVPRDADSNMYGLDELQRHLGQWTRGACPNWKPLTSCLIPTQSDVVGRNMLVGVRCACRDCDSPFCRPVSIAGTYAGAHYVYTAGADPIFDINTLALTAPSTSSPVRVVSVVGGLTGLDLAAQSAFELGELVLFDVNPYAVEFARLVVELILLSGSPDEYVARVMGRRARRNGRITNGPTPVEDTLKALSARHQCSYRWLHSHSPRICERVATTMDPNTRPQVNPHVPSFHPIRRRAGEIPTRRANVCSHFLGHGWLQNETFALLRARLRRTKVQFLVFNLYEQPVVELLAPETAQRMPTVFFTSNILWNGGHHRVEKELASAAKKTDGLIHVQRVQPATQHPPHYTVARA